MRIKRQIQQQEVIKNDKKNTEMTGASLGDRIHLAASFPTITEP